MKSICKSGSCTGVPFRFMQHSPMDEDKITWGKKFLYNSTEMQKKGTDLDYRSQGHNRCLSSLYSPLEYKEVTQTPFLCCSDDVLDVWR